MTFHAKRIAASRPKRHFASRRRDVLAPRPLDSARISPGMANVGPLELGVVLLIALIVFGPKRLPELGQSLGRGIREFKSSLSGENEDNKHPKEAAALDEPSTLPKSVQDPAGPTNSEKTP